MGSVSTRLYSLDPVPVPLTSPDALERFVGDRDLDLAAGAVAPGTGGCLA